jgi:hypothetical protein
VVNLTLAEGTQLELRHTIPPKGNIYDRNGQVLVDQDGQTILLYVIKNNIPDDGCVYTPDTETDCATRWYGQEFGDVLPYRTIRRAVHGVAFCPEISFDQPASVVFTVHDQDRRLISAS